MAKLSDETKAKAIAALKQDALDAFSRNYDLGFAAPAGAVNPYDFETASICDWGGWHSGYMDRWFSENYL